MKWRALLLAAVFIGITVVGVSAGSSGDYGTVPGTPPVGQVNWVAWLGTTNPPSQVMTEDGTNPGLGVNQGYTLISGVPSWLMVVSNFDNPPAVPGNQVTILLGGVGASSGNGWTDSFAWSNGEPVSNQGVATAIPGFSACPTMLPGSQGPGGKVINWSPSGKVHVYRSQNGSGAGNAASNGRYNYVATVTDATYTDAFCTTGVQCWHIVVPAGVNNEIVGCHSLETNPNALTLRSIDASSAGSSPLILASVGSALAAAVAGAAFVARQRRPAN